MSEQKSLCILIIDDEPGLRQGLKKILNLNDYTVYEASDSREALNIINNQSLDLVLLDMKLGPEDGLELLDKIKKTEPLLPVIIITGFGTINNAVVCLKAGALNYITKPINQELLLSVINKEIEASSIKKENISLKKTLSESLSFSIIRSRNKEMLDIDKVVDKIKDSGATVLILGESGTGKEVTARKIHYSGIYNDRPFIGINCAALNDNLLESELFGHEKGAFTGAVERKLGRFELVGGGTIFLDEIGDMSMRMQSKLLRVLQEKTFERVGGTKSITAFCRVIAATNKDINSLIKNNKFREDLYYRLSLIIIKLPPLRERKSDLMPFIEQFIRDANHEYNRNVISIDKELLKKLENYNWPGNVRQLKNIITNGVILSEGKEVKNIELFNNEHAIHNRNIVYKNGDGLKEASAKMIEQIEKRIIKEVLAGNSYNFAKAARELKITRKTLYEKVKKYSLVEKE